MNTYQILMDIAMNLTRVGGWAADDWDGKRKRIVTFLSQTDGLVSQLSPQGLPDPLSRTVIKFTKAYPRLRNTKGAANTQKWAEEMMTWGTIITHRAQLISGFPL